MSSTTFALDLIAALQDSAVVDAFRKARIVDYENIADCVTAKLSKRLKKMEDEIAAKDAKIESLEKRIEELETKADDQEQYSRRTSVRIYGIPETPGENLNSVASALFDEMGLMPTVNRIHRVGAPHKPVQSSESSDSHETSEPNADSTPNNPSPRPILCQFVSYPDKAQVMMNRSKLATNYRKVFVNEDLTRVRAKILFQARELKRKGMIRECWSYDGRIAVKDLKNKIIPIRKLTDLDRVKQNEK